MLVYIYRVRFPVGPSEFELKTEFPIVIINTFKSKYAVQNLMGFY